ncbi:hypothetical protein [Mycolicibacterium lutetiense]|uniref:Uncharacterized protein n=1 Tax=Mycolicibacterium lutetiense TaxID=1641992 RepID=A0ABS4ZR60_9MYCO|nr:hypothetical protein [Mycolicibacterium lutetiense]MBP2451676.1 hypothetical protein [Mycolicibacterium lutetiense]
MRLGADGGLWSSGPVADDVPLVAVLEVSGAVLSWVVDGGAGEPPSITFTDPERADWLWRVVGEAGHVALLDALHHREFGEPVDLAGVEVLPGTTGALRRLAIGHWLRRWWPASDRDGIGALERPLLDAELALLTVTAEDFFTDDSLDSDVAGLLAPHLGMLSSYARQGDPRVVVLVEECRELAGEIGLDWPDTVETEPQRDDYALAAGTGDGAAAAGVIARGADTVVWSAVPPGVFDAAEGTIEWSVLGDGSATVAMVQVALSGPDSPVGIQVGLRGNGCAASGSLDATGRAVLELRDPEGRSLTETQAWNLDWARTAVRVGAKGAAESAEARGRVREFARARLAAGAPGAFLAEVRAAESDY